MATQQIELQRTQSAYDNEGLQQLQNELDQDHQHLQRMTSEEERADRQKMRRIFNSVRILFLKKNKQKRFIQADETPWSLSKLSTLLP